MKTIFTGILMTMIFTMASAAQSEKDSAKIRVDVIAVMNAQAEAWNRGELEEFMQGYWKSESLVFASGDRVTRGWQKTLDNYKRTYHSREKMGVLTFSDLEVTVISKNAAVVLGSWSLKRAKDEPKGKFTLIFRKLREGWRIVHDHTS
jgi:ketosteroid isomerase-like protein